MLRTLLLALIVGIAAEPAAAQTPPKTAIDHSVEFAKVQAAAGGPLLARCAVIRYWPTGSVGKSPTATSLCIFLKPDGTAESRNDLGKPNDIVPLTRSKDAGENFDTHFKTDFPKRDPKVDVSGIIGAEKKGKRIRRFVVEGSIDDGIAVKSIDAPAGLEKETRSQQYQKLKDQLEAAPEASDGLNATLLGRNPIASPENAKDLLPDNIGPQLHGLKTEPPPLVTVAALERENARLKEVERDLRRTVAAKDQDIAALQSQVEPLSKFDRWGAPGNSDNAVALLSMYFGMFQPLMQSMGPGTGLIAPPVIGTLVLLLSGFASGALLVRLLIPRPALKAVSSGRADLLSGGSGPAQTATSRAPLDEVFSRYTLSQSSSHAERIRRIKDMLDLLGRSDDRFADPANFLGKAAADVEKLEGKLDARLTDMVSRIETAQEENRACRALIAGDDAARLKDELWRQWGVETVRPVLNRALQLREESRALRTVLNELGTEGRRIIQQFDDGYPPDANPLRQRLAVSEEIRSHLAIPADRVTDASLAVRQIWTALKSLIPDLSAERPTAIHGTIATAVRKFAVEVSPPGQDGAMAGRSLLEIAADLKARQTEAEQRYREGNDALRKLQQWEEFLVQEFGPLSGVDAAAQVSAWAAMVKDGRSKAQRFDVLSGELEAQRARSEWRWKLASTLLSRVGYRIPAADDDSALANAIHRAETDNADLFLLRTGLAAVMPPLTHAVGALTAAGRNDVVALLSLDQFQAELVHFADTLEGLDPSIDHEPVYYWDRLISPSIIFLHKLMRAELVLQTYFMDDPVFEAIRWRLSDVAWLMRRAVHNSGAQCRTASLLQPAPSDASLRYQTAPDFRTIPEIRRKVLEREAMGGEFAVDLHAAGFAAPFSNTALTLILFNPADWV